MDAVELKDWPTVQEELRPIMDGITTDGPYGRELIQLVRQLPLGVSDLFDRYRAVTAIDYGDWSDLQRCLQSRPLEPSELVVIRDAWLAAIDQVSPPNGRHELHQQVLFQLHDAQLQRDWRRYRSFAHAMLRLQFADVVLDRRDIPANRHLTYRRLQDAFTLACAEANSGSLRAAAGFAKEGQRLGSEGEPLRIVARDVEEMCLRALGLGGPPELKFPALLARPTGLSPLGTWEILGHLLPFIYLTDPDVFEWSVQLIERVSWRMGSPRALLQAQAWRVASDMLHSRTRNRSGLDALLMQSRHAATGLRVLPSLLEANLDTSHEKFTEALHLARTAGNMWARITALVWMTAINPSPSTSNYLSRLLEVTGWRRPVFVPTHVAADAALGLTATRRGEWIVELAECAGRPNVITEVAARHLDDANASEGARLAALRALARLGTSRSREMLVLVARGKDRAAALAQQLLAPSLPTDLTEREVEVLRYTAKGLTNKEIGGQLGLSEHTIARHIANARSKLGAANRAEAVSRLAELSRT